ncbi:MAG: hypothetical protein Kilf2KO_23220 [Rhodospirillales bacterium]
MKRRDFLVSAAAYGLATSAAIAESRPFTFGLTPVFLTNDRKLLALIKSYLEDRLGRPVQLVLRRTYQEITTMLLAGELDAAWICGYPFVRHARQLDLVATPVWQGRPLYQAYLIVHAGREAGDLEDLSGDVHAFSDPDSNSGYLVTRSELAARDAAPDSFFAKTFFTYGHRNVVRAVSRRLAQSGSVDGYVWDALTRAEPDLVAGTRVVWRSEWLGFPPIACRRGERDRPELAGLAKALLEMAGSAAGRQALTYLQLDGFTQAEAGLFDGIAARVRSLEGQG